MKDKNGIEYNLDSIWLDHFQWKEPVFDEESGLINLITPHADPHIYEYEFNFLFTGMKEAIEGLKEWDLLEEAIENNWVLVRVHADVVDMDLSLLID